MHPVLCIVGNWICWIECKRRKASAVYRCRILSVFFWIAIVHKWQAILEIFWRSNEVNRCNKDVIFVLYKKHVIFKLVKVTWEWDWALEYVEKKLLYLSSGKAKNKSLRTSMYLVSTCCADVLKVRLQMQLVGQKGPLSGMVVCWVRPFLWMTLVITL